jgi:hypothetical protein
LSRCEGLEPRRLLAGGATPVVVDLLAVYTPAAASLHGGDATIIQRIGQSVASMNAALVNSEIALTVRLVHVEPISYTGSNDLFLDRIRLRDPSDGHMDSVHTLRNQYGADVVALVVEGNVGGGNADLLDNLSLSDNDTRAFSANAWNSIGPGNLTLAHEIGHNIGAGHERDNPTQPAVGPFPYSYGYRFTAQGNVYHDVMSYDPGMVVPYFANPAISYLGAATGSPIGAPDEADLAATFAVTAPYVAAYRPTVVPDTTAPVARLLDIRRSGNALTFTVRYADDSGIDLSTIDSKDITVSGPGGFIRPVTLLSTEHPGIGGAFKLATYRAILPFTSPATSSLTFTMHPSAVQDVHGAPVSAGAIAKFADAEAAGFSYAWARDLGALGSGTTLTTHGSLSELDTEQVYKFSIASPATVSAAVSELSGNADILIARDNNGDGAFQESEIKRNGFEPGTNDEGIAVNLPAGTYFAWVYRITDTPFTLGLRAYSDSTPPTATLDATDMKTAGAPYLDLAVTYSDDFEMDGETTRYWSVIDIRAQLDGGGDFTFYYFPEAGLNGSAANAPSKTIYYRIFAFNSGSGWTSADNGLFTISIHPNQTPEPRARDGAGNDIALLTLGSFRIAIGSPDATAPTATLLPGAPVAGQSSWDFSVTYHDNVALNATTVDGNDVRVTGPGGFDQLAQLVSLTPAPSIGSNRVATYRVNAPGGYWDGTDDGIYTIALQANQVRDTSNNAALPATLGTVITSMPHLVSQGGSTVAFAGTSSSDAMTFDADAGFIYFNLNDLGVYQIAQSFVARMSVNGLNGDDQIAFLGDGTFNGAVNTAAGANTLTIGSGANVLLDADMGAGSTDLSATVESGATLHFAATQHLTALTVLGSAFLAAGGSRVLVTRSLAIPVNGKLDLNDNDLVLDYTGAAQLAAIQALINSARNFGAWDGPGITSTAAASAAAQNTTLGAMTTTDYWSVYGDGSSFAGESIDGTCVLVKYTYYGDTDFNGYLDGDDYARTDNGFNTGASGWLNGDADGNGFIDGDDYSLIDNAFNTQDAVL